MSAPRFASAPRPELGAVNSAELLAFLPPEGAGEDGNDGLAWLHAGRALVGWGQAWRCDPGTGAQRFAGAAEALRAAFASWDGEGPAPVALASFTFDPRTPGSFLRIPQVALRSEGAAVTLSSASMDQDVDPAALPLHAVPVAEAPSRDRVRYAGSSMPDLLWLDAVSATTRLIEKGGVHKVVLARDHAVWSKTPFDARLLAQRLAARFPDCFTFICEGLVGASPELLVRRRGRVVESLVLAGSAARSADSRADQELGADLLASGKEQDEHAYAVASVRDVLAAHCADLDMDAAPSLLRLDNVQHLATRLRATLPAGAAALTALELAGLLHPTAAVCGTPSAAALDVIRRSEGMERGRYTGPVGWVDANGDGEFAIALRCAELSGARARLFAGAGIVAASLPEAELEETRLKLRAMQSALDPGA